MNNRLKIDKDPSELYPLKRPEEMPSEEKGYDDKEAMPPESADHDAREAAPAEKNAAGPAEKAVVQPVEKSVSAAEEKGLAEPAEKSAAASAEENEDKPAEKSEDKPALSKRERFRKFWTKERIEILRMVIRTAIAGFFAILFLMPIILTITNSLMTKSEINANYGVIFAKRNGVRVFISNTVNLKFIPDIVSFEQYFKVLILSPEYLLKFWNSLFYVVPIVAFQLAIASLASYGFARYRGRVREVIFFAYIILMLMPYQVTLVPNYLVSSWLNILNTRWAIWLPGFFSPFAVYMLTKYMRRIPKSIYEAAEIDGAGEWQIFTKICLPNCRGGIASIAILLFID